MIGLQRGTSTDWEKVGKRGKRKIEKTGEDQGEKKRLDERVTISDGA